MIMASDPRLARHQIGTPPHPPPPPPPPEPIPLQTAGVGYDGVEDEFDEGSVRKDEGGFKLKFCTVCASNQNRYVCHMR